MALRPWDKGRPTLEELCPTDPNHYRRSEYNRLRVDGNWYRCGYNGCIHSHADQNYITRDQHFQRFHGFATRPDVGNVRSQFHVVSRAEGERLRQILRLWQKGEKAAGRPETPCNEHGVPQTNARPFPTAPVNLQGLATAPAILPAAVLAANDPTAIAAAAIAAAANAPVAPPANVPAAAPINAPMAPPVNANNQQRTVINHMCYMCNRLFASRGAVKTHAQNVHATLLIQEPFQPDRVPKVEVDAVSKQPVKLVESRQLQKPEFSLVSEELRELFYKELLTIPTAMHHGRNPYDQRMFRGFILNKLLAEQTMPLFSKFNFLIQISISSYEEVDLDIFERTLANDLQVVPSDLAPKLGQPALSISIGLLSDRRVRARRVKRRVEALAIYTEQGLIDLVELMNRYSGIFEFLKIEFAEYASAVRFGSVKRMVEQYLGYLRNIENLLWRDSGSVVNNKTTQRMREPEPQFRKEREEKMTRDLREITITLQEQIRRRMVGPARMTESWLTNCLQVDAILPKERMLGPNEGTEGSRRLQCARKQLASDVVLARLQLLELRQECEPYVDFLKFDDPFEPSRKLYRAYKNIKARIFRFPGVPDSFRADAHLNLGIVASRIARKMLDVWNECDLMIFSHDLDPDLGRHDGDDDRALVAGLATDYASVTAGSDAGSESDEDSMDDDRSEQLEESVQASDEEPDMFPGLDLDPSPDVGDMSERRNSAGSDADSEDTNSTKRGRSLASLESRPTYDTLWGRRDADAESNTSEQTLPGNRRHSSSDAGGFSYDDAMGGMSQEDQMDFSQSDSSGRSAISSTGPASAWNDGDAMEDVQHSGSGSFSEHSVDEGMEDVRPSFTAVPFLNESIASSDGQNSDDEDGYDTDDMSTATESTIRPHRERPVDGDDDGVSETSTYVRPPEIDTFSPRPDNDYPHEVLRQDNFVTAPVAWSVPARLARIACHHFYYADKVYLEIRDGRADRTATTSTTDTSPTGLTRTVKTTTTFQTILDFANPNDPVELPCEKLYDALFAPFNHKLEWDEDMPARPVEIKYGHGMHKPFEWVGAPALVEHWEEKYGKDVAFERMGEWQKRPVGWEEEGEEMRKEIGAALDEIVEMAKKEGR